MQAGLIAPQRFAAEVRDLADVVGNTDLDEFASEVGKLGREFAETELGMEQARRRIQALDQIATGHTRTQEELAEGVKGWRVQLADGKRAPACAAGAVGKLTSRQTEEVAAGRRHGAPDECRGRALRGSGRARGCDGRRD